MNGCSLQICLLQSADAGGAKDVTAITATKRPTINFFIVPPPYVGK